MKFDMHCHTKEGSMDASVEIEQYIKRLKMLGFGGMLVSDHNSYKGYRRWQKLQMNSTRKDFIILKGIEYDTIDCGHILVIMPTGVELNILEMRGLPVRMLIRIVHHHGGILGPAHPFGVRYLSFITTGIRKGIKKAQLDGLMKEFDFIEIFNACESMEDNCHAAGLARKYKKPGFGGSDAHRLDCVGMAYTELPDTISNETELIKYVKSVNYIRCGGRLYRRRTKDKIGKWNELLVQGFYVYNKLGSLRKSIGRNRELKRIRQKGYIEMKKKSYEHK